MRRIKNYLQILIKTVFFLKKCGFASVKTQYIVGKNGLLKKLQKSQKKC